MLTSPKFRFRALAYIACVNYALALTGERQHARTQEEEELICILMIL